MPFRRLAARFARSWKGEILDASGSNMDRLAQQGEIVHTPSAQKSFPFKLLQTSKKVCSHRSPLEVIKARVEDLKAIYEKSEGKKDAKPEENSGKKAVKP
uniref:Uncharacterized protein n=1 Tax=Oryza glumipatula TaxID=40148 RepID=A0A0D9ZAW8_9ORYZ